MKNNKLNLLAFSLMLFLSQASFATNLVTPTNHTYDSTAVSHESLTPRIECTRYNVNDVDINSTPTMNAAAFDPSRCINQANGSASLITDTGNGNLGKSCPNNYPRLRTTVEGWLLLGGGNGTPTASAWCCQDPPNKARATTAWENTSSNGGCF
jgi:hypothetical protein